MARKFKFPGSNSYGWNCELCEEIVVTAAYEEVRGVMTEAERSWSASFDTAWYLSHGGLSVFNLSRINAIRKRNGLDQVEIQETDIFDYGRNTDASAKAKRRGEIREDLLQPGGLKLLAEAKAEMQALPPPHQTYEASRNRRPTEEQLTAAEKTIRAKAVNNHRAAKPAELTAEIAISLLGLVSDDGLRNEIINRVPAEAALEVAKGVGAGAACDALIRRALGLP